MRLLLSTQDLSGYEYLPIAQIKRAGEGESLPKLDSQYFPPLLAIDAWPALGATSSAQSGTRSGNTSKSRLSR